jgi:hypothetical protein
MTESPRQQITIKTPPKILPSPPAMSNVHHFQFLRRNLWPEGSAATINSLFNNHYPARFKVHWYRFPERPTTVQIFKRSVMKIELVIFCEYWMSAIWALSGTQSSVALTESETGTPCTFVSWSYFIYNRRDGVNSMSPAQEGTFATNPFA